MGKIAVRAPREIFGSERKPNRACREGGRIHTEPKQTAFAKWHRCGKPTVWACFLPRGWVSESSPDHLGFLSIRSMVHFAIRLDDVNVRVGRFSARGVRRTPDDGLEFPAWFRKGPSVREWGRSRLRSPCSVLFFVLSKMTMRSLGRVVSSLRSTAVSPLETTLRLCQCIKSTIRVSRGEDAQTVIAVDMFGKKPAGRRKRCNRTLVVSTPLFSDERVASLETACAHGAPNVGGECHYRVPRHYANRFGVFVSFFGGDTGRQSFDGTVVLGFRTLAMERAGTNRR